MVQTNNEKQTALEATPIMSLVLYPDSDQEDAVPVTCALKRKRSAELPPLPAAFHNLYAGNARISTSDDPSLHGGRKRAIPHIEGNWPSHVYLEWVPSQLESQSLHHLIGRVKASIEKEADGGKKLLALPDIVPSLLSPLGTPLPLHISLSRTLQIKTDDRASFLETLTSSLRKSMVKPFSLQFSKLKWVPNYQRNRWFLVLVAQQPPKNELNRLLDSCNTATRQAGHPGLYEGGKGDGPMQNESCHSQSEHPTTEPSDKQPTNGLDRTEHFHVSVAWNLTEPDSTLIKLANDMDVSDAVATLQPAFDTVKAKIGNTVHTVELGLRKTNFGARGGLLGLG